ncbi:MAG: type IV pilin N-terminal domain-containing protein [Thermoplasmatales archaeon]|nr:type IV pilin N-terminal domain-containing protein [Thermoplasmatales archaeon]
MKNKEAVSPIIGVVLLLAITIVLASVMFLWVSGIVLQSGSAPVGTLAVEKTGNSTLVNYTITLTAFRPRTDPKDIVCYFYDGNGVSKGRFDFPESPGQKKSITVNVNGNRNGNVNWTNDDNNMVSSYDVIHITIEVSTDKDRTLLSTYSFALRYKPDGALIAQADLS